MHIMASSTLDIGLLNKVRGLIDGGSTEGERAAAQAAAERIARAAGMSVDDAIRLAKDAAPGARDRTQQSSSSQPSAAAKAAEAEHIRREDERRREEEARFAEAERKFGPSEKAFAETPEEQALRIALEPFADFKTFLGSVETYLNGFAGWTSGHPPAKLMKVLDRAIPMPTSILDAWEELLSWDELYERRAAYNAYHEPEPHIQCRTEALASILDTMPVRGWRDFDVRMKWRSRQVEDGMAPSYEEQLAAHTRLEEDSKILRDLPLSKMDASTGASGNVQNVKSPVAVRRDAVITLLKASPELSDRDIARRCGVSPQTVNNHRHAMRVSA
jgi:hypothetical protein